MCFRSSASRNMGVSAIPEGAHNAGQSLPYRPIAKRDRVVGEVESPDGPQHRAEWTGALPDSTDCRILNGDSMARAEPTTAPPLLDSVLAAFRISTTFVRWWLRTSDLRFACFQIPKELSNLTKLRYIWMSETRLESTFHGSHSSQQTVYQYTISNTVALK